MKNMMVLGIVLIALFEPVLSGSSGKDPIHLSTSPRYAKTLATIIEILEHNHYQGFALDDTVSVALLNRYLEALDSRRAVFLKEDIDTFRKYRPCLDDAIQTGQLEPVFEIFRVYVERVKERVQGVDRILDSDLDFSKDDEFEAYDGQTWARSRQERDARWRRRIKHEYAELSFSGRSDEDILSILRTRYRQIQKRATDANADEVFRRFVDTLLSTVDPHSGYFLPHKRRSRGQQDIPSLEGIGVQLKRDEEFVTIKRVFAGGAADRSRRVHPGDRIHGVGEGRDGTMLDVVSWSLPDVVDLIRGPSGSLVRLQLISLDAGPIAPVTSVTLMRDRIKLRELRAHKSLINVPRGMHFGVIQIPRFYMDYAGFGRGLETYSSTQICRIFIAAIEFICRLLGDTWISLESTEQCLSNWEAVQEQRTYYGKTILAHFFDHFR